MGIRALLPIVFLLLVGLGCKSKQVGVTPPPAYVEAETLRQANPIVQVRGDVRNHVIPWNEDLTLARAVVAADYYGRWDPLSVTVRRGTKVTRFSAARLLSGQDMFLEPGDVIDIHR